MRTFIVFSKLTLVSHKSRYKISIKRFSKIINTIPNLNFLAGKHSDIDLNNSRIRLHLLVTPAVYFDNQELGVMAHDSHRLLTSFCGTVTFSGDHIIDKTRERLTLTHTSNIM